MKKLFRKKKFLATEILKQGLETIDDETYQKLSMLAFKTYGGGDLSRYNFKQYCRNELEVIKSLDEERAPELRLASDELKVQEAEQELAKLKAQRDALGEIPGFITGPTLGQINYIREKLARYKPESELKAAQEAITRAREILVKINKYQLLKERTDKAEMENSFFIQDRMRVLRNDLSRDVLPKSIKEKVTNSDLVSLLKACGIDEILSIQGNESLKSLFESISRGEYNIFGPQYTIGRLLVQMEKVLEEQEELSH